MFSIERCELPEIALLSVYRRDGAYTDCYAVDIDRPVSQPEYIRAFYTTALFRAERTILKWAVSKPSTDEEAGLLADAKVDTFAAWHVEARLDDQLLLSDFRGRTRSWLMSNPSGHNGGKSTRLYFGSAVVPLLSKGAARPHMGMSFGVLLPFHRLYSRALLSSAKSRLLGS